MVGAYASRPRVAHAGAVAYLRLWGTVVGGWQLARGAKIATARFYADALLPSVDAHYPLATGGGEAALALAAEQF